MSDVESTRYFVTTDAHGIERRGGHEIRWPLPPAGTEGADVAAANAMPLVLHSPESLLEELDELVFVARPGTVAPPEVAADGSLRVASARLVRSTPWDPTTAAAFALDCAEHVLGDAATVELPGGHLLGDVLVDARRFLERSVGVDDQRIGLLARLATARRLRRSGRAVGDVALGLSMEDLRNDLDASLDPAWTTAATVEDAVLAALEAIRHIALPRYAALREEPAAQQSSDASEPVEHGIWATPWGPFITGAEHESPYLPAALSAREAAQRARETALSRGGASAEAAERRFQLNLLLDYLAEDRTS